MVDEDGSDQSKGNAGQVMRKHGVQTQDRRKTIYNLPPNHGHIEYFKFNSYEFTRTVFIL